ncbi:hypothetical protein KSP40_PGU012892 [Platanthera guangdongensis]|uniref:P-type ATPase A domain-containing protein n=1 Tax=Platanthera guangdongensis TaxID=2320717 RepID=A0ABR2LZK2_9ASPA
MISLTLYSSAASGLPPTKPSLLRQIRLSSSTDSASYPRFSAVPSLPPRIWICPSYSSSQPRLSLSRPPTAVGCGPHDHHADHNHNHHSQNHHGHAHSAESELNSAQKAILGFAKAVGWTNLADLLREHLQLCCCSMALLILAAACPYVLPARASKLLQNAFISIAFPLIGVSAALDAVLSVAGGKINIHVLMAFAAFASVFMGNALEGAFLLAMFSLAHIAEEYFTSRSNVDVKELKDNHPDHALKLEFDEDTLPQFANLNYKKIPVQQLELGSYILVRAGEAVPVDGEVFQGASTITIEHLTGESKPVDRKVGDTLPGGARNLEGMMIVKTTKSWEDSTLNKIMRLTEEGQLNKPKLQRWLDEFGEQYSKVVVALSLAVTLLGPVIFKWPFIGTSVYIGSIYRALGLMVAASPCALAVAPLAYATAISSCASKGILLKGGHVLDAIAACDVVAFDKTGTLTTGKLMCKAIEPIHGHRDQGDPCCNPNCENEALAIAAAMEKGTTHPIGRAVVDHSVGRDLPNVFVESFESLPGRGLSASLTRIKTGKSYQLLDASLGSVEYIASLGKSVDESEKVKKAVKTSAYGSNFVQAALSVNEKVVEATLSAQRKAKMTEEERKNIAIERPKVTLFHFEDEPRPGVHDVVSTLRDKAKLRLMMLTGDHESSAWRVAKAVGISEVYSNLKPEDKLNHVKKSSRDTGGGLVMVGDGINDAPALAAATVGIVLAQRASATAIAVADVLLLRDNISCVPFCIAKARQTTLLVKQSVALALSCIIFASLLSVLGSLPLWLTVLLHEGGTLLVCLNSIRALNEPTWSWREDLCSLFSRLRLIMTALVEKTQFGGNIRPAPL